MDRRKLARRLAPLLVATSLTALASPASGAPAEALLVEPSTGTTDTDTDIVLRASTACPGATHGRLTVTGAGFPDRSSIFATVTDADKPVTIPLGVTWNALAAILHAPVPLSGIATVNFVCSDADERTTFGEFATLVEFVPTEARAGTYSAHPPEERQTMQIPVEAAAVPHPTPEPAATTAPKSSPPPTPALDAEPNSSAASSPSPVPQPVTGPPETVAPPDGAAGGFALAGSGTLASGMSTLSTESLDELASGGFTMTVDSTDPVLGFGTPVRAADFLLTTTHIKPVTVRDNRPGGPAWSVSAQIQNFGPHLSGRYLGWTPYLISPGAGAAPGESVISGFFGGNGLLEPRILASAGDGHPPGFATFGATLDLRIPVTTPPGTYTTTLTITALS